MKDIKKSKAKMGENNPLWKGDKVSKISLHQWIASRKPKPKFCECCGKVPPRDIANISQQYKRDVKDFEWLCRKCHMTKDGRIEDFKKWYGYGELRKKFFQDKCRGEK